MRRFDPSRGIYGEWYDADAERGITGEAERDERELEGRRLGMATYSESDVRDLQRRLEQAEQESKKKGDFIANIKEGACQIGWVAESTVASDKTKVLLSMGGALLAANKPAFALEDGDAVRVISQTMQIVDKITVPELGAVCRVGAVVDGEHCEVDVGAERRLVKTKRCKPVEGDRIVLDVTGRMAMLVLPQQKKAPNISNPVTWADVGGHHTAKAELIDAIESPYKNPAVYERYGQRPIKGVLLHGPPGCGKSLLGKAVASSIAMTHGGAGSATSFIYVKGPEIINKYVGESESNVRSIFDGAREHKRKHGYPAVIFIDEAEALLGHRGADNMGTGYMTHTVVPAFLAEMDGLEESAAFVLLATNLPASLDPAVVRDGRIDRKVLIGRPDEAMAEEIFALHLRGKPGKRKALAKAGAAMLFDPERVLFMVESRNAPSVAVTLAHVTSGAMVEGIVARATQLAIRREIASGEEGQLLLEDVLAAIVATQHEVADLDHGGVLHELGVDVSNVRAIRRASRGAAVDQVRAAVAS